jgi:hypothetical protein
MLESVLESRGVKDIHPLKSGWQYLLIFKQLLLLSSYQSIPMS